MTIEERRLRERAAQRHLIISTARILAEREGWDAVTTRRLSSEIEYSQPVIYKHFSSLDDLAEAVALDGFRDLTAALRHAREAAPSGSAADAAARGYNAFAVDNPALYDVMFMRATRLRFGTDDASLPLATAYAELRAAVDPLAGERDVDVLTEVLWASLHGLVLLDRAGRLRPGSHADRIELLIDSLRTR